VGGGVWGVGCGAWGVALRDATTLPGSLEV